MMTSPASLRHSYPLSIVSLLIVGCCSGLDCRLGILRGVSKVVGTQSFLRARLLKRYNPVINDDGEFTTSSVDNRVLTAVTDTMLAGRISLEGKSRDEIIRIFQAVGGDG